MKEINGPEELEAWFAEMDQWHVDHPWRSRWCRLKYRLGSAWVTLKREPRHRYERARYGVSYMDAWGLDHYIAGVIARGCEQIAGGHGHPGDMAAWEWENYLRCIAADLHAYADPDNFLDEAIHAAGVAAMRRFTDRFGDMWD